MPIPKTTYALLFLALWSPVVAQGQLPAGRPTPAEAQVLLQTRPDLVAQLRQRFATSGLSRDQVHERLKAEGYPEDLLDNYLPGSSGAGTDPSDDVFRAVKALGVADDADVSRLRAARATPISSDRVAPRRDSTPLPTTPADSGFAIFGLDLFSSTTSQFDPNVGGSVDATYRLGPGDHLVLILTGDVEQSYQLEVTREGFIVIPQVGQIYVANLTLGQLEQVAGSRLSRVYSGVRGTSQGTTKFSISVSRLRTNQIIVTGDVLKPGSYQVSSAGTALTALYAAGGPSVNGSLRRVEIRRGGILVDSLDVYDYIVRGDASHDVRLQGGDVVFVPPHGSRARIVGEIARPATYELKARETLADLVRNAGGFRATASRQRVLIERIVTPDARREPGTDRLTIDVSPAAFSTTGPGISVADGDVVRVFPIAERVRNRLSVAGNVYQPGDQGLTPGEKLSEALRKAGGLQPDTYLGEVLITRRRSDGSYAQIRRMLADTVGHVVDDPAMQEDDQVTVFSLTTFRPDRYVVIGGAVNASGRFPYREGMTVRDLVLLAKGLAEGAYLKEAEIARMPASRENGTTAATLRVPLDSTYLFERKPNGEYRGPPGLPAPAAGAPDIVLEPYDNVLILRQPDWALLQTVSVAGEVRFPGVYTLAHKNEHLSDIVARAGGLTEQAYAEGATLARTQFNLGRVGINLQAALRDNQSYENLIMRAGDSLAVPPYNAVVSIRGAVNQPSSVAYVPGRSIDYYIGAAGGPSRNADEDRAYVVQPGGKLESLHSHWFRPTSMPTPGPGSVVTVPERDPADKKDFLAMAAQVGQILAGLTTLIVLARQ
jgi:protein involved in polysaccharide export with SLBB domain